MGERPLRLLCDANPMAYGSSGALLAILDHVDAEAVAMVRPPTDEILSVDPAVRECLAVDVKDARSVAALLDARCFDAALVVANRNNLDLYHERGLPTFFVDCLFWYGGEKEHPVWDSAAGAFVQDFPGVEARVAGLRASRRPTVVGAIIRAPSRSPERRGTFVNLGGVRSRFIDDAGALPFLAVVREALTSASLLEDDGPVVVACGAAAASALSASLPPRFLPASLSPWSCLRAMARAARVLTAPGLNAVCEALACDVPLAFLPPQNPSQVHQLAVYERAGLVGPGLNLDAIAPEVGAFHLCDDESTATERVRAALAAIASDPARRARVAARVALSAREAASTERAEARRVFWARYGRPGASEVGEFIRRWWRCQ